MGKSLPGFLWWDSAGLAVFVEVEIIGVAGGASRLPYKKADMVLETRNHISTHSTAPYGNWAVYGALAVIVKVKMLAAV